MTWEEGRIDRMHNHPSGPILDQYLPGVTLLTCMLPGSYDFPVTAAMVCGTRHRVVIDSLIRPADLAPFRGATLVVYTHYDWDHCWGTAALPGVPVIGHRLTRERLAHPEMEARLRERLARDPEGYAGSQIVLPDITFEDRLAIDAGGLTVELHHLPGHTADSVVAYVPELDLLLAGDAVEEPLPSLNEVGRVQTWARELRRWCGAGLKHVVPGHGRPGGLSLLEQNAAYIEGLVDGARRMLAKGQMLEEIQNAIPLESILPAPVIAKLPSYYPEQHRANIARVVAELTAEP